MLRLTTTLSYALALGSCVAQPAGAQGGPPMLTDDPGTPGNGNFELNLAATLERSGNQTLGELPTVDLNYGVGQNIQLNLETSFVIAQNESRGPVGGLGAASAAVKWRFLDQENAGVALSTYPRIERALLSSSIRRGLAESGTRFFLPVEAARNLGSIELAGEIGPLLSTVGRAEWSYGLVGGTAVSSALDLMLELHGSARANFSRDRLTVNCGLRQQFSKSAALIASLGHDVRSPEGEGLSLISYLGVQLEF